MLLVLKSENGWFWSWKNIDFLESRFQIPVVLTQPKVLLKKRNWRRGRWRGAGFGLDVENRNLLSVEEAHTGPSGLGGGLTPAPSATHLLYLSKWIFKNNGWITLQFISHHTEIHCDKNVHLGFSGGEMELTQQFQLWCFTQEKCPPLVSPAIGGNVA